MAYVAPFTIAEAYAEAGNKEEVLHWLNVALAERDENLVSLMKVDFVMDPVRSDPRFTELLRKTGLQWQGSPSYQGINLPIPSICVFR